MRPHGNQIVALFILEHGHVEEQACTPGASELRTGRDVLTFARLSLRTSERLESSNHLIRGQTGWGSPGHGRRSPSALQRAPWQVAPGSSAARRGEVKAREAVWSAADAQQLIGSNGHLGEEAYS